MADDGRQDSGAEADTTNQRMELTAVLRAVESIDGPLEIHSDSTYVVNCFNDRWYEGWKARGWKNAQKKPVANRDLWEPLIDRYGERADEITFEWVKGHSGNPMNELADQLAVAAVDRLREEQRSEEHAPPDGPEPPWPVDQAVVVTGVRELDADQAEELEDAVVGLDGDNDVLVSGLRLGAELHGAELARRAGIPYAAVLPFDDPVRVWSAADKARFDEALAAAKWVITLDLDPSQPAKAIKRRNAWLWTTAVGAIVVGDEPVAEEAETAGLGVIVL